MLHFKSYFASAYSSLFILCVADLATKLEISSLYFTTQLNSKLSPASPSPAMKVNGTDEEVREQVSIEIILDFI